MQYKIIFISILQFSILSLTSQQCTTCQDLSYLSCNICYDSCTPQQSKQFQKCQYTYCTNYVSDTNDTRTCTNYQIMQLQQDQCFIKCCSSTQNYFSIDQLNKCVDKNKQIMTTSIIVSIVVGVAFFFIFVLCCLCFRRRRIGCCESFWDRFCYFMRCGCFRRDVHLQNFHMDSNRSHQQLIGEYLKWQQDKQINQQIHDQNSNCAVCLTNGVNAYTVCKHSYHIQCIMQWFNRKPICPLCKSGRIQNIKLYCRICCIEYVRVNLNIHKDLQKIILEIKGPNCPKCQ